MLLFIVVLFSSHQHLPPPLLLFAIANAMFLLRLSVSRWIAVFLCFSLIALVFPIFPFRKLHWLPLQARIDYKICVLCFKCINKTAPSYLSDLLEQYVPSRLLRSGSQNLLKIPPRANKKCTEKAFKHCAPYIWNSLPSDIREAKSESQFKNYLKTHLFKSHLCI